MLTPADIDFILKNEGTDITRLLLGKAPEGVNLQLCAKCIGAREKMKVKAPLWYANPSLAYPFSVSVEQGSSQATALLKQRIIADLLQGNAHEPTRSGETGCMDSASCTGTSAQNGGKTITADLTGGMGIDSYFISRIADTHYYFEREELLCRATEYNFGQLGADKIITSCRDITSDGCAALKELEGKGVSLLYIDPARRTQSGGKAILLQDYEPDITSLQEKMFAVCRHILVKVSPMADIKLNLKQLPKTAAIYVVAVENECKELLFLLDSKYNGGEPPIYCYNIALQSSSKERGNLGQATCNLQILQKDVVTVKEEEEATARYATEIGAYLYEPNKALLKSGAYKLVSQRYGCRKLAVSTHLYTSGEIIGEFPGKVFKVEEVVPFNKRNLKEIASRYPMAALTARNFHLDTNALKKLSGIKDGGSRHIFAVTLANGEKVIAVTANIPLHTLQSSVK